MLNLMLSKNLVKRLSKLDNIIMHPYFQNFRLDKVKELSHEVPYHPKPINIIKLKTSTYKEFLKNESTGECNPEGNPWYDYL